MQESSKKNAKKLSVEDVFQKATRVAEGLLKIQDRTGNFFTLLLEAKYNCEQIEQVYRDQESEQWRIYDAKFFLGHLAHRFESLLDLYEEWENKIEARQPSPPIEYKRKAKKLTTSEEEDAEAEFYKKLERAVHEYCAKTGKKLEDRQFNAAMELFMDPKTTDENTLNRAKQARFCTAVDQEDKYIFAEFMSALSGAGRGTLFHLCMQLYIMKRQMKMPFYSQRILEKEFNPMVAYSDTLKDSVLDFLEKSDSVLSNKADHTFHAEKKYKGHQKRLDLLVESKSTAEEPGLFYVYDWKFLDKNAKKTGQNELSEKKPLPTFIRQVQNYMVLTKMEFGKKIRQCSGYLVIFKTGSGATTTDRRKLDVNLSQSLEKRIKKSLSKN